MEKKETALDLNEIQTFNGYAFVKKLNTKGKPYKELVNGKALVLAEEDYSDRVEIVSCTGLGLQKGDVVIISTPLILKETQSRLQNQDLRKVFAHGEICYVIKSIEILAKVSRIYE